MRKEPQEQTGDISIQGMTMGESQDQGMEIRGQRTLQGAKAVANAMG